MLARRPKLIPVVQGRKAVAAPGQLNSVVTRLPVVATVSLHLQPAASVRMGPMLFEVNSMSALDVELDA